MNEEKIVLGSDVKFDIHVEPIGSLSMQDYDFFVEVFVRSSKILKIEKEHCVKVDADNYRVTFNTRDIGVGSVQYRVTAFIPDNDFDDGLRTEIAEGRIGLIITSNL